MKKALISAAVAAACSTPFAVLAQAAPAAPAKVEPEYTITGNAGLFSDYRFRGYSQTDYNPAFQGGIDFAHKSGFYLGNWNSNVNSTLYNGASLEMDFYGGYKATFGDFGLDVGTHLLLLPRDGTEVAWRRRQELGGLHRRLVGSAVREVLLLVHRLLRPEQRGARAAGRHRHEGLAVPRPHRHVRPRQRLRCRRSRRLAEGQERQSDSA